MSSHSATTERFVVIAEFQLKRGCLAEFLKIADDDARRSVADEPGCHQFDVVALDGDGRDVAFYEVYTDRAAFDAHLKTPHLARFREAFPALIERERPVRFGVLRAAG